MRDKNICLAIILTWALVCLDVIAIHGWARQLVKEQDAKTATYLADITEVREMLKLEPVKDHTHVYHDGSVRRE